MINDNYLISFILFFNCVNRNRMIDQISMGFSVKNIKVLLRNIETNTAYPLCSRFL